MGETLREIKAPTIVTWLISALAAITFFLAQDAMSDVARTLERVEERLNGHLEDQPSHGWVRPTAGIGGN